MRQFRFYKTILGAALSVGIAFFLTGAGQFISQVAYPAERPSYDFLPPLRLNVATLKVIDDATPLPENEARVMRYTPNMLLKDMARQRFICEGKSGEAVLNIRQASFTRHIHDYSGRIILSLTLENPAFSKKTGTLSAEVSTTILPFHGEKDSEALERLTAALLDDMNVEIEYQLRNNFSKWIVPKTEAESTAPLETAPQTLPPPTAALSPAPAEPAAKAPIIEKGDGISEQALPALPAPAKQKKAERKTTSSSVARRPHGLDPLPPPPKPRSYR